MKKPLWVSWGSIRRYSHENTTQLSERVRQYAMAGIAVIWIFRVSTPDNAPHLDQVYLWPLMAFIFTLVIDVLQYSIGSILYYRYDSTHRLKAKALLGHDPEDDELVEIPRISKGVLYWMLALKTVVLLVGYVLLGIQIGGTLFR